MEPLEQQIYNQSQILHPRDKGGGSKEAFGNKLTIKELWLWGGSWVAPSHTSLSPLTYSLPNSRINQPATNLSELLCA